MSDNRTTELLHCPFCGGEASKRLFYREKYRVHCNVCDAHSGGVYDTEAEAIAAWNTRATHGTLTAELVEKIVDRNCEWYEGGEIDAQAIADELNAELGSGTCNPEETETITYYDEYGHDAVKVHVMECDECGGTYEHVYGDYERCPRCGKVVE